MIYHILHKNEWLKTRKVKVYAPKSLKEVGFIHCSTKEQVLPTANRRYEGAKDLLLLEIDESRTDKEVRHEDLKGAGEEHPHIYGELHVSAISRVLVLESEGGKFKNFPGE